MDKIVRGVQTFQQDVFRSQQQLFDQLAGGQSPEALFITCSDSRIDPCLVTQTQPGDIFVLRNAGNIVPAYGASNGGEAAAVEYAVAALGVKHVVVCGHSLCGAMQGLLNPESLATLPTVAAWLEHAASTRQIVHEKYSELSGADLITATVRTNVLAQLDNLKTHPSVAAKLTSGDLNLHAWVYTFEAGQIHAFNSEANEFVLLEGGQTVV